MINQHLNSHADSLLGLDGEHRFKSYIDYWGRLMGSEKRTDISFRYARELLIMAKDALDRKEQNENPK